MGINSLNPEIEKNAIISSCGGYRYELIRIWDRSHAPVVFVMMNPSTADWTLDDATIRKCVGFAKAWGHGGIRVVNLFAVRSRDPLGVFSEKGDGFWDPIGPDNDFHIRHNVSTAAKVVVAWGCESTLRKKVPGKPIANRVPAVLQLIREQRPDLDVL